ncbi:MAG TPA: WGR domain-containing protein [Bradyrhizobium sp.]|jgi:predicted DNA-binding WGR domain protein
MRAVAAISPVTDPLDVGALTLYRIEPARRMRRFYVMDVQPDLFGQRSLIREWGRFGSPRQMRIATRPNRGRSSGAACPHPLCQRAPRLLPGLWKWHSDIVS